MLVRFLSLKVLATHNVILLHSLLAHVMGDIRENERVSIEAKDETWTLSSNN